MKTQISFRLRQDLDDDLIALKIDEKDLPDLCRNGLRLMLGITTQKSLQVVEQPIAVKGKAAVFIPAKGGSIRGKV